MKLSSFLPFAFSLIACGAKDPPRETTSTTEVTSAPLAAAPAAPVVAAPASEPAAPAASARVPVRVPSPVVAPPTTALASPPSAAAAGGVVPASGGPRPARNADLVRRTPLVSPGLVPAAPVSPSPTMYTTPQGGTEAASSMSLRPGGAGQVVPGDFSPRPLQVAPTGNQLTNLSTSPSFGGPQRSF